jgi:cytosine/creatinine deaminase
MTSHVSSPALLLRNATLDDGSSADVLLADGRIAAIGPDAGADVSAERVDLTGHLLVPSLAEPHAHLDKAFLAETVLNPTGDLMGAILAMRDHHPSITVEDTTARATRAVELMLSQGVTAIRTHADTVATSGLLSVEALIAVREQFRGLVDIQVVALTGWPTTGAEGAEHRALLRAAIDAGIDAVGGCPHLEDDPDGATDFFLDIAGEHGLPLDLHTDETLDPHALGLEQLARRVLDTQFEPLVTASHCVSLGVQTEARQREIAELVAEAGIGVVALPHTNLFLQGRDHQSAMPRGLTAVKALRAAGVTVCAGADNLQDPFNPVGRGDPLETAGLMIMAAHLLPDQAFAAVSSDVRRVIGIPPVTISVGAPADLVAIPARTVREAIAFGPARRHVFVAGRRVVSPS